MDKSKTRVSCTGEVVSTDWDALDALMAKERARVDEAIKQDFAKFNSSFDKMKDEDWL